mmetsp:Transcript_37286/g.81195  ORF Transcript_37286/g.81195 Transcript_37286/m.81195 type:complete len:248 (-) Transcript_37286:466-1209(-)
MSARSGPLPARCSDRSCASSPSAWLMWNCFSWCVSSSCSESPPRMCWEVRLLKSWCTASTVLRGWNSSLSMALRVSSTSAAPPPSAGASASSSSEATRSRFSSLVKPPALCFLTTTSLSRERMMRSMLWLSTSSASSGESVRGSSVHATSSQSSLPCDCRARPCSRPCFSAAFAFCVSSSASAVAAVSFCSMSTSFMSSPSMLSTSLNVPLSTSLSPKSPAALWGECAYVRRASLWCLRLLCACVWL